MIKVYFVYVNWLIKIVKENFKFIHDSNLKEF